MTDSDETGDKPRRLYKQSYLQLIHNSVGTAMFRNFYVVTDKKGTFDALNDGQDACAFYVSAVLVIFGMASSMHGTVAGTVQELTDAADWREVAMGDMQPGDVLVWAPTADQIAQLHIGFYVGNSQAVSNSTQARAVAQHVVLFDGLERPVERVLRFNGWPPVGAPLT